jgi:hypothetical protein
VGDVQGKTLLHLQCHFAIESVHEYPFAEWDMGFTVEGPGGTWVMPDSIRGEVPLSHSPRARKPA